MSDGSIKIIIGAAQDRSVDQVFGSIEKRAQKAGQNINKSLSGTQRDGATQTFDKISAAAQRASKNVTNSFSEQVKAGEKAARAEEKIWQQAAKARAKAEDDASKEIIRGFQRATRERAKELRKQEAEEKRAAKQVENERKQFAERTSHRAMRFMFPNPIGMLGMAHRVGGDILRGAGIDFNLGSSVGRAVNAQAMATQLSNQGFMRNEQGPNGTRVSASVLESEARRNAQSSGYTTEQALASQTKFVDLTGNLDDARKAMPAILKLSGATGTDPEKMAEAWANVSRHMGDIPDKAAKVEGLMRLIAGQGRVGSIEIKDEAKDLGKIAAMADKFGGDRATSIGKLATLAQMARAEGGAASSSQAATSIVAFTNTMTKGASLKNFFKAGFKESDIFNMTGSGKNAVRSSLKDPFEIIKVGLEKTGGDVTKFGKLFNSVMASRATNALAAAYNSDGGRNMKAVDAKLAQFGSEAALTTEDVDKAQSERMKTAAAQAVVFQEKLDEVGKEVASELLPALKDVEPYILKAAHAFGELVSWAGQHPVQAIFTALTLAIARAGAESALRSGIEGLVTGGGNSSVAALGTGTATGGMGTAGKVFSGIATGAVAGSVVYGLGTMGNAAGIGDATTTRDASAIAGLGLGGLQAFGKTGGAAGLAIGGVLAAVDQAHQLYKETDGFSDFGGNVSKANTPEEYDRMMARERAKNPNFDAESKKLDTANLSQNIGTAIAGKTLNVRIINPQDIKNDGPGVNPSGRGHDPGKPKR